VGAVFDLGVSFGTFLIFCVVWILAYFAWAYFYQRPARRDASTPPREDG
jgi:hypothetical protein